jgi:hypothetical protein
MNFGRIKVDSLLEQAYYHVMNHLVAGAPDFADEEKEMLRKFIWATAEYCGLVLLTYAVMSNHYHALPKVPMRREVSDAELLRRYRDFHPRMSKQREQLLAAVEKDMAVDGPLARKWRDRQLRQMFDISRFGALLDQRFSIWYNRKHDRKGTLWMRRFKSVLVEDGEALLNMSLYIDMNPCEAGVVADPKDYRFCGYAEAVAGIGRAREGLQEVFQTDWAATASCYRAHLLVKMKEAAAVRVQEGKASLEVMNPDEYLSLKTRLACRLRYYLEGKILGSAAYVGAKAALLPGERKRPPRELEPHGLPSPLCVLGRLMRSDVAA